jgi:hypothetical protein
MQNTIVERYFTQEDFSKLEHQALQTVCKETGFVVEHEIFRGVIYNKNKVGSLIYQGRYNNKPAVLKLQGLKPEVDEYTMISAFNKQNKSGLIRPPHVYLHKEWGKSRGFGYLITEYIDAPNLFTMPFAAPEDMQQHADFFQEYRTKALTAAWLQPLESDCLAMTERRVNTWQKISESVGRLTSDDYKPYLEQYHAIIQQILPSIPLVFCHSHLTANDVFRLPGGKFIIMSNLFWAHRPQWYELAFNLWACWMHIRDTSYTFSQLIHYLNAWLDMYETIPVVRADNHFRRKINAALFERSIGSILVELGASDFYGQPENAPYLKHMLKLQQQLFNYLADKL